MPLLTTGAGRFPSGAAAAWNVVFSQTLNANDGSGWNGFTMVQKFAVGALSHNGSQVRLRLVPPTAGSDTVITGMYISHAGGTDPYDDSETSPTAITPIFVGASGSFTLTAGGASVVADAATFALDISKVLLIAFQFDAPANTVRGVVSGLGANFRTYYKSGADAATPDKTAYSDNGDSLYIVDQIEAFY